MQAVGSERYWKLGRAATANCQGLLCHGPSTQYSGRNRQGDQLPVEDADCPGKPGLAVQTPGTSLSGEGLPVPRLMGKEDVQYLLQHNAGAEELTTGHGTGAGGRGGRRRGGGSSRTSSRSSSRSSNSRSRSRSRSSSSSSSKM